MPFSRDDLLQSGPRRTPRTISQSSEPTSTRPTMSLTSSSPSAHTSLLSGSRPASPRSRALRPGSRPGPSDSRPEFPRSRARPTEPRRRSSVSEGRSSGWRARRRGSRPGSQKWTSSFNKSSTELPLPSLRSAKPPAAGHSSQSDPSCSPLVARCRPRNREDSLLLRERLLSS